jgi:hypothetical protein
MGNSLPNESSIKTIYRMRKSNYEKIVKPSGKITGEDQLKYIEDNGFIKKYEEPYPKPYPVIDGHTLEYYIPEGTKLYHSSFKYYQNFDNKNRFTYFGIDIIIALWYLFELSPKYPDSEKGYIYEFNVKKDIPVYILKNIKVHPKDTSICQNKKIACIHPQYAYHGYPLDVNENDKEMSTELTMNLKNYPIGEYIERARHPITKEEIIYLADINKLREIADAHLPYSSEHNSEDPISKKNSEDRRFSKNELEQLPFSNSIRRSIKGIVMPDKNPNNKNNKKGGYRRVLRKTKKTHLKSRK